LHTSQARRLTRQRDRRASRPSRVVTARLARRSRAWRPLGNERLTASTGFVVLVLLAIETLTTLSLRSYLPVHIFLGLLLLPLVALKLTSTGWRFLRYSTPQQAVPARRASDAAASDARSATRRGTLTLFGSGVALIVAGTAAECCSRCTQSASASGT
jgi:hypothetical protein